MEKLGKYTILERIGKGTMGVVYRAHDESLGEVAIKFMSADLAGNPAPRDRFIREARVAASLNHPNIIVIHGMGEQNGRPYIVMECLEGESLKAAIHSSPDMPLERRLGIMKQVADALAYAHNANVAHRDVKPDNIFLTRCGDVRILDFGIARVKDSTMTATGVAIGTPAYMSPEQVVGKKVDRRADVFASGTVFYELLTGERAFKGSVNEIFDKILKYSPPPVHHINPLLPEELTAIVERAMEKNPAYRYQSMNEFLLDLNKFEAALETLRDALRLEAEAATAMIGNKRATSGQFKNPLKPGDDLPTGYFELRAAVGGLTERTAHTDAMIDELQWVAEIAQSPLEDYGQETLRRMANRLDEIKAVCSEENTGVTKLGQRLLDELRGRLQGPPRPLTSDPSGSGEFGLST